MSSTAGWAMPGVALKRMRGSTAGRCSGAPRSRSTRSSAMSTSAFWAADFSCQLKICVLQSYKGSSRSRQWRMMEKKQQESR